MQNPPPATGGPDQHRELPAAEPPAPFDPPPPAAPTPSPLRRSTSDSIVGGVCGGLGLATGVDPVWFRLGFIFLALSSGIGVVAYLIAWVAIPEASPEEEQRAGQANRNVNNGAVVFGILLLVVGSALLVDALLPWFDRVIWPLGVIGLGLGLLYLGSRR